MSEIKNENSKPALYIFMRNDLDSLTSGRAMAQASHATNCCEEEFKKCSAGHEVYSSGYSIHAKIMTERWSVLNQLYTKWKGDKNFGTAIVLSVNETDIWSIESFCDGLANAEDDVPFFLHYGDVVDPTYRIKDGDSYHVLPVLTCFWGFGARNDSALQHITQDLELYP